MAKARAVALQRAAKQPPGTRDGQARDAAALERELADLRAAIIKMESEKMENHTKLIKAEKEAIRMQKLVSDVLVEQKPAMAQEFRKLTSLRNRVGELEADKKKLAQQLTAMENDTKVQTTRQLKDEVTAYQLQLQRVRADLEASRTEATENARVARLAKKRVSKTSQRTAVQTKRQTERVLAARHSADLEALSKQSKLLKRELKSMQGKDWVVECARLESMLQQAYTIVKHVEAQREESISQQEEMRQKIIELDHSLEAEVGALGEERKRTMAAEKRLQRVDEETARYHKRCMLLEEQLQRTEDRAAEAKAETAKSESQMRRVFQHGFEKMQKGLIQRAFTRWHRSASAAKISRDRFELTSMGTNPMTPVRPDIDPQDVIVSQQEEITALREQLEQANDEIARLEEELRTRPSEPSVYTVSAEVSQEIIPPVPQRKPSMSGILADLATDLAQIEWKDVADVVEADISATPSAPATPAPAEGDEHLGDAIGPGVAGDVMPIPEPDLLMEPELEPEPEAAVEPEQEAEPEPEPEPEDEDLEGAATKVQAKYRGRAARQQVTRPRKCTRGTRRFSSAHSDTDGCSRRTLAATTWRSQQRCLRIWRSVKCGLRSKYRQCFAVGRGGDGWLRSNGAGRYY
jgi:hypothetical protein